MVLVTWAPATGATTSGAGGVSVVFAAGTFAVAIEGNSNTPAAARGGGTEGSCFSIEHYGRGPGY